MKLVEYLTNLTNAAVGSPLKEGFSESPTPGSLLTSLQSLYSSLPIVFIFHALSMVLYGLGAARLSYCYQMSTNPSSFLFYPYVVLAFIFSPVYYPFYGIFLNPLCRVK